MNDGLLLLCGALLLYVPGLLLLTTLRVRRVRVLIGTAPVVTIAFLQLIVLVRWALGTGLARTTAVVLSSTALLALVLELRAGRDGVLVTAGRHLRRAGRSGPLTTAVAAVLLTTSVIVGMSSWLRGFGGLATAPQEHDTVTHAVLTAWIAHTERAGPFEVLPTDLLSGSGPNFYPAGTHAIAGLLAMLSRDPVSAFNATIALVVGLVGPVTLFAAAVGFESGRTRPLFSACAALISVTLYRPWYELAHDAGIMAFDMGLALIPSVAVGLSALGPRGCRTRLAPVVVGLVAMGLYTTHPSVVVAAAASVVIAGATWLACPGAVDWLRSHLRQLLAAAGVAALLTAPWAVASVSTLAATTSYPETPPQFPFTTALQMVGGFQYGGFIGIAGHYQVVVAIAVWTGFLGCLTVRRLWPVAAVWLAWVAAAVLYGSGHADLPGLAQLGSVFYNSWPRIVALACATAPAVAGLGISALVAVVLGRVPSGGPSGRRVRTLAAPVIAGSLAIAFFSSAGLAYADINAGAVAERWGKPTYYRLHPLEAPAFDYLAAHRADVGRVLNNANDGSTFLYVYKAIPVVNTYPEGTVQAEYGIYLMQHLNEIATNRVVRCLVQRYDITHVILSASSPPLLAARFPHHWVKTEWFRYPPGFAGLGDVPQLSLVFSNPNTLVFRVASSVLAGDDRDACTSDPARPLPATPASG